MLSYTQVGYHARDHSLGLHKVTYDPSTLKPTELLVKVGAAAINPIDLLLFNTRFLFYFSSKLKGFGRDFSGVVEAAGSDVTVYQKGDKISGLYETVYGSQGSFTEYLIVDTKTSLNIGKIPKNLSLAEAAAFPLVFGTAYTMLTIFKKPQDCDRVLVIGGATSVGAFAIQLLKNVHNVATVIAVCSAKSSEAVKAKGADIVVDYTSSSVTEQVAALTKDIGQFDLILDCVGSRDIFPVINNVLKPKSENSGYVTIVGDRVATYHNSMLSMLSWGFFKRLLVKPSYNYKLISEIQPGGWYEYAVGLFEAGTIKVPVDTVYEGIENYTQVVNKLIDHRAQGKVVLKIAEE